VTLNSKGWKRVRTRHARAFWRFVDRVTAKVLREYRLSRASQPKGGDR
jgi:hypothetical protein